MAFRPHCESIVPNDALDDMREQGRDKLALSFSLGLAGPASWHADAVAFELKPFARTGKLNLLCRCENNGSKGHYVRVCARLVVIF